MVVVVSWGLMRLVQRAQAVSVEVDILKDPLFLWRLQVRILGSQQVHV